MMVMRTPGRQELSQAKRCAPHGIRDRFLGKSRECGKLQRVIYNNFIVVDHRSSSLLFALMVVSVTKMYESMNERTNTRIVKTQVDSKNFMCKISFCEILHLFSRAPTRNLFRCYCR